MRMLHEQIKNGIKNAMISKNEVLLKTLRSMVSAFTNELVAKSKKPSELLNDEEVLAVIARLAKQRKDSIEQFQKGNREDLVKEEQAELTILETYLPKMMEKHIDSYWGKTSFGKMANNCNRRMYSITLATRRFLPHKMK